MECPMRAAFALLADRQVHNLVRKISWEFHQKYRTGTRHCCLPPHISLKQPFYIESLPALEQYMEDFARSMEPFQVHLTKLDVVPISYTGTEYGILWIDVNETLLLRGLHNRLNEELNQRFSSTPADYDGDAYHFHMTVMIGGQPIGFYRELENPVIDHSFTVRELAMFVYDEPSGPDADYLSYKIFPIGESK